MYIKIELTPEGVGAFRIKIENDLLEEDKDLSEEVDDVVVSASYFEDIGTSGPIEKAVDFLTRHIYEIAEQISESYILADEELRLDAEENLD